MNAQVNAGWADRLGSPTRYSLIVLVSVLGIFMLGMIGGFSYAIIEGGRLPTKPQAYLSFAAIIGVTALVGWVLATLIRSLRAIAPVPGPPCSDRRCWRGQPPG